MLYLLRFNFTLKHVSETKMEKVDKLSRRPDWKVETRNDNDNQILMKEQWIYSLVEVIIEEPEVDIVKKKARGKDKKIVRVVEEMKKVEVKELWGEEWQIKGDLILKEGKVYIPKDEALRVEIIQLYHNVPVAEHGGKWKTMKLVTRNYW